MFYKNYISNLFIAIKNNCDMRWRGDEDEASSVSWGYERGQ